MVECRLQTMRWAEASGGPVERSATSPSTDAPTLGPSQHFWAELAAGRLALQRCVGCGLHFHRPRLVCPRCQSEAWTWVTAEGSGTVYSVTTVHSPAPSHRDVAPIHLALVDLAEQGARVIGRVVAGEVRCGSPVRWVPFRDHLDVAVVAFEAEEAS